ncbi:MAG: hypothetical protein K9N47_20285 [Prosthecobacter sp.]|uniref:hypothetical protein n=1 Tax=Prosthecobacter sp. TaxID=1965333 RepID=UPI002614DF09|nr:hypothetical protein [Prosthecobacter sp.]MCF7788471.1 hypothetical protein [Prosthecobacter sp.]
MKPLPQAIEAIRAALKEEVPPSAVEDAAVIYAQLCSDVERRLDLVAAMLQKGSDYQALQVAEEDPPLLDLAASVSFGEEKNWQIYCDTHGLKVAPRVDIRIIQDLETLYGRGISANHPLYKDFRAAVLSRDDAKALRIVKTILKLNPQDANAQKELQRLENKALQEKIDLLREALKTDDEERIATLTEDIKAVAPPSKLERLDVFEQGESIRQALRRRQAEARVPDMLSTMKMLMAEGRWRQVGQMLSVLNAMFKEHGFAPADAAQKATLEDLTQYHLKERAADEKQRNFDRTLKTFLVFVEEVETRLLTGAGVTYDEITGKDESFVKRWKELEGYQLPVAAESLQRLRAAGQELRAKLERMQRAKRLGNIALAAAALVLLCCISAIGLHAWKAWTLTQELASYQAKENYSAAEGLIKKLRSEEELLLRWPYLQARIEEVSSWAAKTRVTGKQAADALLALENSFQGEKSKLTATQLVRQLDDAGALVKQLGGDVAAEPKNRLVTLKTKADLHLATVLKQLSTSTSTTLGKLEQRGTAELSHEKIAANVSTSCTAIDKELKPLEALLKPEVPVLALPADLETRIRALRQRLNTYQEDLRTFAAIRKETGSAGSLDDYRKAVTKWQTIKFAEAAPSLKMLDTLPTEKAFQAALFTGGDQEVLQAVLDDKSGRYMAPDTLLETELKMILSLLHNEYLNNIFESSVVHYSSKKSSGTVWSMGKPEVTVIGDSTRWSAKFYEPDPTQRTVLFIQQSFTRAGQAGEYQGAAIATIRQSQTSELMNLLDIGRISDEKGERVLKPLLEVCDKLVQDTQGSSIAKAYVLLKFEDLMRVRPREWGLHYCPSLQQDLRILHQTLGTTSLRSEDWLVPDMREKWQAPLAAFFKPLKDRAYLREAHAHRNYLRAATKAGLKFAGYVETDLSLVLNPQGSTASELWVLGRENGKPLMVANPAAGKAAADAPKTIMATASVPLSPAFYVTADRRALLQQYQEALSSTGVDITPLPGESLFLNHP